MAQKGHTLGYLSKKYRSDKVFKQFVIRAQSKEAWVK